MNCGIVAGTFAACALLAAGPATAASTVVFTASGVDTSISLYDLQLYSAGYYVLQANFDRPVNLYAYGGYLEHWGVFLAPATDYPQDEIEGNDSLMLFGVASEIGQSITGFLTVPEMYRIFFNSGEEYANYGVPIGTPVYYEQRYDNPFINLSVIGEGQPFRYDLRIIRFAEVPEPTTWALMITGFAVAGGAVRRRNRVHA